MHMLLRATLIAGLLALTSSLYLFFCSSSVMTYEPDVMPPDVAWLQELPGKTHGLDAELDRLEALWEYAANEPMRVLVQTVPIGYSFVIAWLAAFLGGLWQQRVGRRHHAANVAPAGTGP